MKKRNKLKLNKRIVAALAVLLAVGFAYISSAINIGGVFTLFTATYDVHFDNLQVTDGSVEADTPTYSSNDTKVRASVRFTQPGDFYEFTIDAVNAGTIDAMLNTVDDVDLTEEQEKYIDYKVTYADGEELAQYQELNAGDSLTFKIRASFKENINKEDLPEDGDTLDITFDTEYIRADDNRIRRRAENTLYNVLKDEAESGGLAKKYTGEHQDSIDASISTKDVYYFYGSTTNNKTTISEKNNVIFGEQCWKLYRTTDTGGVRLLYNGEIEGGKCLNSRGTHAGYNSTTSLLLSGNYWYGTSYNYDKENKTFSLRGTTEQNTWNDTTSEDLIGKYTCASTNLNEECSTLYYTLEKESATTSIVETIKSNASYNTIGSSEYNIDGSLPAYAGYMYNNKYSSNKYKALSTGATIQDVYEYASVSTTYWISDSYTYNSETNKYDLVNPYKLESTDEYLDLIGKYTSFSSSATTTSIIYYIAQANMNYFYTIQMRNNNNLNYYNTNYTYGDSYTDNGNNTYTINNATTIDRINYLNNYENMGKKYLCINATNNTCSDLKLINATTKNSFTTKNIDNYYKFSSGYTYENGQYILDSTNSTDFEYYIGNKHYTCWNSSGICTQISYVYYSMDDNFLIYYYFKLGEGKTIENAIAEMFYADDVNQVNSTLKELVDQWYKKNLINYSNYIDNTIYCNNRQITNYGGLSESNSVSTKITFKESSETNTLKCNNITDSFSHNNSKAYLEYNIGILPRYEYTIIANGMSLTDNRYWTISPYNFGHRFDDGVINGYQVVKGSTPVYNMIIESASIRPSISLKSNAFYTSGDGSMENPYLIYTE